LDVCIVAAIHPTAHFSKLIRISNRDCDPQDVISIQRFGFGVIGIAYLGMHALLARG
jgi:hypothetical protein